MKPTPSIEHKELVADILAKNTVEGKDHLVDLFLLKSGLKMGLQPAFDMHIGPSIKVLKAEGRYPFKVDHGGHEYHIGGRPQYFMLTKRVGGKTIFETLLKHLIDGAMVEKKPLARKYSVSGEALEYQMKRMEKSLNKTFLRKPQGGSSRLVNAPDGANNFRSLSPEEREAVEADIAEKLREIHRRGEKTTMKALAPSLSKTPATITRIVRDRLEVEPELRAALKRPPQPKKR